MKVHTLVTINDEHWERQCTLFAESFRVGFPTAEIVVSFNQGTKDHVLENVRDLLPDAILHRSLFKLTHWGWIDRTIRMGDGPLVIMDPDILFFDNVQLALERDYPHGLMSGYRVQKIWNEWSRCPSAPRLHTSMLYIRSPQLLREKLRAANQHGHALLGEYCYADPWKPTIQFEAGQLYPTFWDTGANAYGMLMSTNQPILWFEDDIRRRYAHLNSVSFFHVFGDRMEFPLDHQRNYYLAITDREKLREMYKAEDRYYERMKSRL